MMLRSRNGRLARGAALAAVALAVVLAACGEGDGEGAGNPESELTAKQATAPLTDAPPELVGLREQANQIVDTDLEGFRSRLSDLEGIPVVINKWASWCGPCREEFPYLQSQAIEHEREVAFIGLLSDDGRETGGTFLEQLPLPYPSFLDPDGTIADAMGAEREFPSTLFIDSGGEVAHTKIGPYSDEASLAADIERYAQR